MTKELPNSKEMEMSVLGSLLLDHEAIFQVVDYLEPKDFYQTIHTKIYETILDLYRHGKKIDLLEVSNKLSEVPASYLVDLTNTVPTASRIKQYAETVKDRSIRRQILEAQQRNQSIVHDLEKSVDTVLAETQNAIVSINALGVADDSIKSIIREVEETQELYSQKYEQGEKYLGFQTGMEKLDNLIDGLRPGHVWVVGAFTSTGKTQFALNIVHAVLEQNIPTSIVSLEMSRVDLAARLIGIRHNLSSMKVLKGKLDPSVKEKVEEGKHFLSLTPLEIHTTYFDLEKIKMLIRKDVYNRKVKFVVIDYVQNIISEKGLREYDLMTAAATDLQSLARELGITIYIVSQISNEAEKGQGAGAGFKGTGALEAVADLAIRLRRDRKEEKPDWEYVPVEIIVTKNRHGFTGSIGQKDNEPGYSMWLQSGKFEQIAIPSQMYATNKSDAILPKM